ncbi:peptide deformylase [Rhodobacteraceae bacterium CCMM004]|nr:peptide deformylase [Rhodobacteraceae bacterium CCMM004]
MTVRPILAWPDPRLATVCTPVGGAPDPDLVRDLFDTMYDAPGRGLAAPQVGVLARLFVMDTGWKEGARTPMVCADPAILEASETVETREEGCLSILGVTVPVARPAEITLAFTDAEGARKQMRLSGFAAACAQHELDHLDGLVTFDRTDPAERAALIAAYRARA